MKALRQNKVLGIAIGETSLTAAEVVAGGSGGRAQTRQLAELVYPDGVSPAAPAALGKALAAFLKEKEFTARSVVIGIAARWLVVKPKEVPPTDASTLSEMLRLQAEGEFSSELKDLVFDYAADPAAKTVTSVLLIATAKKYVDAALEMCEAARLSALAVMPSAVALGTVTGTVVDDNALVLSVGASGAELTAQTGGVSSAIRHLRGPGAERSFVGELRRAVSTLPVRNGGRPREMVVWGDAGVTDQALGENLGFKVRSGELPVLGVDTSSATRNGDGRKYAPAVALALTAIGDREPTVDFLHSRLAPPDTGGVPRWVFSAALALIALVALGVYAYRDLQSRQRDVSTLQSKLDQQKPSITAADQFVSKVVIAQAWHGGSPRYLACLRDITAAIPEDQLTYVTSVTLKENTRDKQGGGAAGAAAQTPVPGSGTLVGTLFGKTTDQEHSLAVLERLRRTKQFSDVKPGGTTDVGRGKEVQFSVTFNYTQPNPVAGN